MTKFNRFLWTGLVLGLAACGDDVTVTNPPEPEPVVPGVTAVSVAPDGATINVNGTLGMTAAATLEPGAAAPTWAWSSSNTAIATVAGTTANATVTGVAAGSAGIRATATSGTSSASGVATVFVTAAPACAITGVSVTPETANLVTNQSLQFAATVTGTNCTTGDLGVTWSVVGSPAGATISSSGVFSATAAGNYVIRATSTKDATKTNTAAATVIVPAPATVSIQSITQYATNVPVDLTNVAGQIEITLNVDPGAAPTITKAQALIDGVVVAEQIIAAPSAAASAPETAPQTLVLSTNTRQVKKVGSLYVPVVYNGPRQITARIFVTGSTVPAVSNAVPVVMQNMDAIVPGTTPAVAPISTTPSWGNNVPVSGTIWYKGGITVTGGPNYIAFFPVTPSISPNTGCTGDVASGTPTTGITLGGQQTCAGVEGAVAVPAGFGSYTIVLGTPPANDFFGFLPSGIEGVGSPFTVDGNTRYNLVGTGTLAGSNTIYIDNVAPSVVINTVAFNSNYDQAWINGSYLFSGPIVATDGGSGTASESAFLYTGTTGVPPTIVCTTALTGGADLAETLTSSGGDAYQICASGTDNLGNASSLVGPSNKFGVDKTVPLARIAGSSATAAPSIAPALVPAVSANANTTVFDGLANPYAAMFWGLEGWDNRSGFNQNVVTGPDAACQTLLRTLASGVTPAAPNNTCLANDQLTQVLSDTWIRSTVLTPIDNTLGVGYFDYSGYVIDRAGNQSTAIVRNYAIDLTAPATTFLAPAQTSYTPGQPAAFNIWAQDDLEVLNSYLSITYPGMGPPATGITYPYGSVSTLTISLPWPTNAPIAALVSQQTISIPNILGRVDESCTGAAVPYPNCPATPGSKTPVAADYNWDLNLNAALPNNAAKAPLGVITNVQDIAGRDGLTGAAFSFSIAIPMGSVAEQWSAATDIDTWILNPAGTLSCATGTVCADQKTQTSNGLRYFETVHLLRLNTTLNRWVLCGNMTQQALPQVDNGVYRIWRWTATVPTTGACVGAGFTFWRALGVKNGAGLFSLSL